MVAHDGHAALRADRAATSRTWSILDLMMPLLDGVEVTKRMRADAMTSALPIIMLTAKGQTPEKVLGLTAGADDYMVKPFDTHGAGRPGARRRCGAARRPRQVSPLTGLPGNSRILREIADRMRAGADFAVCYCDIDGFKAVNDAYGFARGDEFIVALARKLQRRGGRHRPPAGVPRPRRRRRLRGDLHARTRCAR